MDEKLEGLNDPVFAGDMDVDVSDGPSLPEGMADVPGFRLPEEPGLYELSCQEFGELSGVPVMDALFPYRCQAVDALEYAGRTVAVRYCKDAPATEDMNKLSVKSQELKAQLDKFLKDRSVLSFQSKSIGCKKCGSQLAKEYLKDDFCPLCGNDLRAPSTIEGEAQYRQRLDSLDKELEYLRLCNQLRSGEVSVLVKVV